MNRARWLLLLGLAFAAIAGCMLPSPKAGTSASADGQSAAPSTGPKRLVVVIPNELPILYYPLAALSTRSGGGILYDLINPGLAVTDYENALRPILVDQIPSLDNGLWKILPEGGMSTTWHITPGSMWHDGVALTSADLAFTLQVVSDRELPALRNSSYDLIKSVDTPDEQTLTINWSKPFIDADKTFTYQGTIAYALPIPKHILETSYAGNKAGFMDLAYWGPEFVGAGPFKLGEWVQGSHLTLTAFDRFVLGRPKLDEIEARFIPDQNTIISNILAGSVDVFSGATVGVDQALQVRDQWTAGKVNIVLNNWVVAYPQFVDPQPAVVLNLQFRRALMHAIDRQAMVDSLMYGLVPVTNSPLNPTTREYKATESSLVDYAYDPQRASQLITDIGYVKGPDGMFRDSAGQPLYAEIRGAASRDIHVKGLFPIVDNWQKIGVASDPVVVSAQQASDLQDQATFHAFQLVRQDYGLNRLVAYHSSQARLPERNYTGSNNGRYMSPELDALIDRYQVTIPWDDRMQVAGQILHHMTDQVVLMPLFYDMEPSLVSNRVLNATSLAQSATSQIWNGQDWDVK